MVKFLINNVSNICLCLNKLTFKDIFSISLYDRFFLFCSNFLNKKILEIKQQNIIKIACLTL